MSNSDARKRAGAEDAGEQGAVESRFARPLCRECGPGYRVGDPGCRHGSPDAGTGDVEAYFDVVFDGPPGPESGRFIESEAPDGRGIKVGEWVQRPGDPEGWWALRVPTRRDETIRAAVEAEAGERIALSEHLRAVLEADRADLMQACRVLMDDPDAAAEQGEA